MRKLCASKRLSCAHLSLLPCIPIHTLAELCKRLCFTLLPTFNITHTHTHTLSIHILHKSKLFKLTLIINRSNFFRQRHHAVSGFCPVTRFSFLSSASPYSYSIFGCRTAFHPIFLSPAISAVAPLKYVRVKQLFNAIE